MTGTDNGAKKVTQQDAKKRTQLWAVYSDSGMVCIIGPTPPNFSGRIEAYVTAGAYCGRQVVQKL